jgi:hypothetical protein
MPRSMACSMTEAAVLARTKTVTRRIGWWTDKRGRRLLMPGDRVLLVRKSMGRRRADGTVEPLVPLALIKATEVHREPLRRLLDEPEYGRLEVTAEGFPGMHPAEFVERFFLSAQRLSPDTVVTRISFDYMCGAGFCECGPCPR